MLYISNTASKLSRIPMKRVYQIVWFDMWFDGLDSIFAEICRINLTVKNTICPGVEESGDKWSIEHLDRWARNVQTSTPSYHKTFQLSNLISPNLQMGHIIYPNLGFVKAFMDKIWCTKCTKMSNKYAKNCKKNIKGLDNI